MNHTEPATAEVHQERHDRFTAVRRFITRHMLALTGGYGPHELIIAFDRSEQSELEDLASELIDREYELVNAAIDTSPTRINAAEFAYTAAARNAAERLAYYRFRRLGPALSRPRVDIRLECPTTGPFAAFRRHFRPDRVTRLVTRSAGAGERVTVTPSGDRWHLSSAIYTADATIAAPTDNEADIAAAVDQIRAYGRFGIPRHKA